MIYVNKKHNKLYEVVIDSPVINSTNDQNGQRMVLYKPIGNTSGILYVRSAEEFAKKFEPFRYNSMDTEIECPDCNGNLKTDDEENFNTCRSCHGIGRVKMSLTALED